MLCQGSRTMSGKLRQVRSDVSLLGASRFISQAPWQAEDVARTWVRQFGQEGGRFRTTLFGHRNGFCQQHRRHGLYRTTRKCPASLALLCRRFPAIMLALAIWITWRYPLDRERFNQIQRQLAQRKIHSNAHD